MPFEQIETLLEKYYAGETSLEEERQLKEFFQQTKLLPDHLKVHAIQFEHYGQEQEVELDKFLADDWLFEKIKQPQMASTSAQPKQKNLFQQYSWQIAASISLLIVAFWAGNYFRQGIPVNPAQNDVVAVQENPRIQKETPTIDATPVPEAPTLAAAETVDGSAAAPEADKDYTPSSAPKTRTALAVNTTTVRASASDRLQLVTQELEADGLTPEESKKVIRQLIKTMNQDNNVNVRLAATEALYKFNDQPEARKALIQALGNQTDPMMQVTLIEMVISLKEKTAIPHLQRLTGQDDLLPIVKYKAQEGLGTLI
ncbi:MAG: HEAT repeat domain-containing protein [Rufibacter sp.]